MRRKVSIIYKILVTLSLAAGILINVIQTTSVSAILSYYTLQSNIICLIGFIGVLIVELRKYKKTDIYYLIKGAITIAILITGLTYVFALAPVGFEMDFKQKELANTAISNLLVHLISPSLVVLDYFLFDEKGNFKWFYPVIWLFIPYDYLLYVYTYSSSGGTFYSIGGSKKFAYFFLDYEKIGVSGVAIWIICITTCVLFISYLLVYIDKKLRDRKERG